MVPPAGSAAPTGVVGPPGSKVGSALSINHNAKSKLGEFCQKYANRPTTKADVVYDCWKVGGGMYQAQNAPNVLLP